MDYRKLFDREPLQDQLESRRKAFLGETNKLAQAQFDASTDDQVVAHISARARLRPIVLHEEQAWMDFEDVKVDVSRDSRRIFFENPSGPIYVPGRRAIICIPCSGDAWLFDCQTNPRYAHAVLRGTVTSEGTDETLNVVRIPCDAANDEDEENFELLISARRKLLRELVQFANGQVKGFNDAIDGHIRREVSDRRKRTSQHRSIAARLNISIKRNPAAPPLEPVSVATRRVPPLATGHPTEFGITEDDYKLILHFIRHQGRTYESTPDTYAVHDEEGLRDIVLGQLNGHFRGAATGETFRCRGKSDIRIEADDRSAFVAECKLWSGKAAIQKAVVQLFSYMMWRDSKAALIVFNKSKTAMSSVVKTLPQAITDSGLVTGRVEEVGTGEWSAVARSATDDDRRISLQIFAFDLHPRKKLAT